MKSICRPYLILLMIVGVLLGTTSAHANAGAPMLVLMWPPFFVMFIPIILVEACVLVRKLDMTFRKALNLSFWANLVSTLIGIPLTWLILLFLEAASSGIDFGGLDTWKGQLVTGILQAPWPQAGKIEGSSWVIPIAAIVLTLFFFLSSWVIEARIIQFLLKDRPVKWPVFWANAASYLLLIASVFPAALLIQMLQEGTLGAGGNILIKIGNIFMYPVDLFWKWILLLLQA